MARRKPLIAVAAWSMALIGISIPIAASGFLAAYKDGAPVGFTGGFGEETCRACHFDQELNDPRGRLKVSGLPDSYVPDSVYSILIAVARPDLGRAGFSMSTRYEDGSVAGLLKPTDSLARLTYSPAQLPFATHTEKGNETSGDSAAWHLLWRSPAEDSRRIIFNIAANAANGDESEFGDWIYVFEKDSRPAVVSTDGN